MTNARAYYNEFDPKTAAWLRELIREGQIASGDVDERSIADVRPEDLRGYTQCHFFAGIGGWSLALRLAGWPDDVPVWTGSCPCQPFSDAGKGLGEFDPRHLWPVWFPLIRECAPAIVFGEQVASKAALGWLDGVFADMEGADYACGASDLCAASVGAPHIRQRCGGLPTPSGTGGIKTKNHTVGRLDEWGGHSNPFRGTSLGGVRCVTFELWMMGFPMEWKLSMDRAMQSSRKSEQSSSAPSSKPKKK